MDIFDGSLVSESLFEGSQNASCIQPTPQVQIEPAASTSRTERSSSLSFSDQALSIIPLVSLTNDPFEGRMIQFLHIPKTAGTNIDNLVKVLAQNGNFSFMEFYDECLAGNIISITQDCTSGLQNLKRQLGETDWAVNPDVKVVLGHMPLPEGHYKNTSISFFSLVRDPVDRLISLTNFLYQRNFLQVDQLEDYMLRQEADNLQTRMLAGESYMSGKCREKTLAKAIENIQNMFAFAAPIEDVEVVMAIIASHFGVPQIAYAKMQVTGIKIVPDDHKQLVEKLSKRNAYDIRLVAFVRDYWANWKANHIVSVGDSAKNDSRYLVLSHHLYFDEHKVKYMSLDDIRQTKNMGLVDFSQIF